MKSTFLILATGLILSLYPFIISAQLPVPQINTLSLSTGQYNLSINNMPADVDDVFWILGDGHFRYGTTISHDLRGHNKNNNNIIVNKATAYMLKKYDPHPPIKVVQYTTGNTSYNNGIDLSPQNPTVSMSPGQHLKIGTSWNPVPNRKHYTILTIEQASDLIDGVVTLTFTGDVNQLQIRPSDNNSNWYSNPVINIANKTITFDCTGFTYLHEQRHLIIKTGLGPSANNTPVGVHAELRHSNGDFIAAKQSSFGLRKRPIDPNLKKPSEEFICSQNPDPTLLQYTIYFQNIGTTFAQEIIVSDMLPDVLHVNSLRVDTSSHFYFLDYPSPNEVEFIFPNAELPGINQIYPHVYTHDETIGFITFSIYTDVCLPDGEIFNNATIIFDQQEPIITNWATTIAMYTEAMCEWIQGECMGNLDFVAGGSTPTAADLMVYPNPVNDFLSIKYTLEDFRTQPLNLTILDSQGRIVRVFSKELSREKGLNHLEVDASNWPQGVYFVKLSDTQEVRTWRFIKS